MSGARFLELQPATYQPHALHRGERAWAETNCYVDLWIEVLHGFGFEPTAALGFTFAQDFEGDQWRFFKFPHADLARLFGVDLQELNVWRSLVHHVDEQVRRRRLPIVEVDGHYLPDLAGTSYRREHPKTSIAIQEIDLEARRLGYFHNAGYFTLEGDDFAGVFRLDAAAFGPTHLAPYVEIARLPERPPLAGDALVREAAAIALAHLAARPENPVRRFAPRLAADVEWLKNEPIATFHQYSFATLRQCGAAFELSAAFLRWLARAGLPGELEAAAVRFAALSEGAKAVQFKLARVVGARRQVDLQPMLAAMESAWDEGMALATAALVG